MTGKIPMQVQYCDNIIRHQNNEQYSLIGIYEGEYRIAAPTAVIPQICLNIVLPLKPEDLDDVENMEIEIAVSDNVLMRFNLPPKPDYHRPQQFSLLIQPILNNITVIQGDKIHVRIARQNQTVARSTVLNIV